MPAGFPSEVPTYPGARLTAAAGFPDNGQTKWGMEWETVDAIDKVQTFYSSKLSQGDWNSQFTAGSGSFAATFSRKSNSTFAGVLAADGSSGVTKISMYLSA